jgi:hypothetical protein
VSSSRSFAGGGSGSAGQLGHTQIWAFSGDVESATGKFRFYNRTGYELIVDGAWISADTAPDTQALIADVNVNGTTIYTDQGDRPRLPVGLNGGPLSAAPEVTVVAGGDYLTVDIDQADGADGAVGVVYRLGAVSVPPPIGETRHNVTLNPAFKNGETGWTGASGDTNLAPVTGLPTGAGNFPRDTGARYSSGGFAQSPLSPVTGAAGNPFTASLYIRPTVFSPSGGVLYLVFRRSPGGDDFTHSVALGTLTVNTVTRVSISNIVAPANTTHVYVVLDGINFTDVPSDISCLLIEPSDAVDAYFDGDTLGATWDGADGDSASTL